MQKWFFLSLFLFFSLTGSQDSQQFLPPRITIPLIVQVGTYSAKSFKEIPKLDLPDFNRHDECDVADLFFGWETSEENACGILLSRAEEEDFAEAATKSFVFDESVQELKKLAINARRLEVLLEATDIRNAQGQWTPIINALKKKEMNLE